MCRRPDVDDNNQDELWIARIRTSGLPALAELFSLHRERLRKVIAMRLSPQISCREDPADIVQEAYLDAAKRYEEYLENPVLPPYLWLRLTALQRLQMTHRKHLGTKMRDARKERPGLMKEMFAFDRLPEELICGVPSGDKVAVQKELQAQLQVIMEKLDATSREILLLRHFEELSNSEVACLLKINKSAASNRYIRAMQKLRQRLGSVPDFADFLA
jgi:RNA polymerase sigma-70 factor, ECF subfamily